MPTVLSRAPMSLSSPASTLPSTADMPRCMLIPWSPSPIAESSCVSCSLFASTSAANARIQRRMSSWPRLMRPDAFSVSATSTILCLCRPSETRGLDRRIPETSQLLVQLQQRDRATRHLQRRDVGADQVPRDRDPTLAQEPVQVVVDDVQLDQRRAAHAVDEGEYLVALLEGHILDDRSREPLDDLGRGSELDPLAAGLAEKICGAAAEEGRSLAEVAELCRKVNANGRSMGMALTSCIVPAAGKPTFELGDDEMEIGIGIHGEPGRERVKLAPAAEIVERLTAPIVEDVPFEQGDQVLAFVNGMGGTPLIELYVVYNDLNRFLGERGITIARNLIGPYITSLEMAGCSITLLKLDEELTRLWDAPVKTAGLRWAT